MKIYIPYFLSFMSVSKDFHLSIKQIYATRCKSIYPELFAQFIISVQYVLSITIHPKIDSRHGEFSSALENCNILIFDNDGHDYEIYTRVVPLFLLFSVPFWSPFVCRFLLPVFIFKWLLKNIYSQNTESFLFAS